jgi:hypothetical protein
LNRKPKNEDSSQRRRNPLASRKSHAGRFSGTTEKVRSYVEKAENKAQPFLKLHFASGFANNKRNHTGKRLKLSEQMLRRKLDAVFAIFAVFAVFILSF